MYSWPNKFQFLLHCALNIFNVLVKNGLPKHIIGVISTHVYVTGSCDFMTQLYGCQRKLRDLSYLNKLYKI